MIHETVMIDRPALPVPMPAPAADIQDSAVNHMPAVAFGATTVPALSAFWQATSRHRWRAAAKIRLAVIDAALGAETTLDRPAMMQDLIIDPNARATLHIAVEQAARLTGHASPAGLLSAMNQLSIELEVIEELRETLLGGMRNLVRSRIDARLSAIGGRAALAGLRRIRDVFDAVDTLTDDILAALRRPAATRRLIRSYRQQLLHLSDHWSPALTNRASA